MVEILMSDYHIQMTGYCCSQMPEDLLVMMTLTSQAGRVLVIPIQSATHMLHKANK